MPELNIDPRKPIRYLPWIIAAAALALLLILSGVLTGMPQVLAQLFGKLFSASAGVVLGAVGYDKLMLPYFRPSSYLMEPWTLNMIFKHGKADHEIVSGKETLFMLACSLKVLTILGVTYMVSHGN